MEEMALAQHDVMDMEPLLMALEAKMKDFIEQKGDDLDAESIKSATLLAEQIRRQWDSMQDKKFKTMMSMDVFNLINMRMGEAVAEFVTDPELLEKIMRKWERISVEASTKNNRALMTGGRE